MINIIGNALVKPNKGGGPSGFNLISGYAADPLNRFCYVAFDPDSYHSSGGGVQASDLSLIFSANGGTATNCVISSVTKTDGSALVGGENVIKVNLTITGNCSGVESITIGPSAPGSIKDSGGRLISGSSSTGTILLSLTYHANYQAVLLYALNNNIGVPVPAQRLLDNTMVTGLSNGGYWTQFDVMYFLANNLDHNFALINWINPGTYNATISGTPVWTANIGTRSDGSGYLNTNFAPATNGVKFAQTDASLWVYSNDNVTINAWAAGCAGQGAGANTGRVGIKPSITGPNTVTSCNRNTGSGTSFSNATGGKGLFVITHNGAANEQTYQDGTLINTVGSAGSARSDKNVYINCSNENGTASSFNTSHNIGFVALGSNLQSSVAAISTILNTWITATTTPSPPADSGRFYVASGQSNMSGGNSYTEFPSYLKTTIPNCYFLSRLTLTWVPLLAGTTTLSTSSPLFELAYAEQLKYPGEKLYFVEYAVGGSLIDNWLSGGTYYNTIVGYINTAKSLLTVTHYMPYYWFHGEEDSKTLSTANAYAGKEQTLMSQMFSAIGTTNAVVFQINPNLPPAAFPYASTVNTAKVNNLAGGYYGASGARVQTSDLIWNGDNIHLATIGGAVTAGDRGSAVS